MFVAVDPSQREQSEFKSQAAIFYTSIVRYFVQFLEAPERSSIDVLSLRRGGTGIDNV